MRSVHIRAWASVAISLATGVFLLTRGGDAVPYGVGLVLLAVAQVVVVRWADRRFPDERPPRARHQDGPQA